MAKKPVNFQKRMKKKAGQFEWKADKAIQSKINTVQKEFRASGARRATVEVDMSSVLDRSKNRVNSLALDTTLKEFNLGPEKNIVSGRANPAAERVNQIIESIQKDLHRLTTEYVKLKRDNRYMLEQEKIGQLEYEQKMRDTGMILYKMVGHIDIGVEKLLDIKRSGLSKEKKDQICREFTDRLNENLGFIIEEMEKQSSKK